VKLRCTVTLEENAATRLAAGVAGTSRYAQQGIAACDEGCVSHVLEIAGLSLRRTAVSVENAAARERIVGAKEEIAADDKGIAPVEGRDRSGTGGD